MANRASLTMIGKLRHRVTLLAPTIGKDPLGQHIRLMQPVQEVWAEVIQQNGREWLAGQISAAESLFLIRMHYRDDVRHDWQINWRGVILDIVAPPIDMGGKRQWLEIKARWQNTASLD